MPSCSLKTLNGKIFKFVCLQINLTAKDMFVFQRLLGFLLRNDKPFPYSAPSLSENTGFSVRSIFNAINALERHRLIERIGLGKNRKFKRGSKLIEIITTMQISAKYDSKIIEQTRTSCSQESNNRAPDAYNKTSSFLKHGGRFRGFLPSADKSPPRRTFVPLTSDQLRYSEYYNGVLSDMRLGLTASKPLPFEQWLRQNDRKHKENHADRVAANL